MLVYEVLKNNQLVNYSLNEREFFVMFFFRYHRKEKLDFEYLIHNNELLWYPSGIALEKFTGSENISKVIHLKKVIFLH